jgi:hypothetical protein
MKELKMVTRRPKTILVVCALLFLVQQAHVGHCSHHHHHNTTDATGTKRGDLVGVVITAAASVASTYLSSFLTKKRAAVINVVNLSDNLYVADGCDADTSTHIGNPPGDLNPNEGATDIEVEIESKYGQAKNTLRYFKKNFVNGIYNMLKPIKEGIEPVVEQLVDAAPEAKLKETKKTIKAKLLKLFNLKPNAPIEEDERKALFEEDEDAEKLEENYWG